MNFARGASWLFQLFTASDSQPRKSPSSFSNDVSLTQPYDGGGIPLANVDGMLDQRDSAVGVTWQDSLFSSGPGEIIRVYAVSALVIASTSPDANLFVYNPVTLKRSIVGSTIVGLSTTMGEPFNLAGGPLLMAPGLELRGEYKGGGAATQVRFYWYIARAPLGTVFYV